MDLTYINTISDGDIEFIETFIETFESNTATIITSMEEAFSKKDLDSLKRLAHQLKPSLEMLKLDTFELCLDVQNHPENTSLASIQEMKDDCIAASKSLREEFNL